jgi:hypothetical protein
MAEKILEIVTFRASDGVSEVAVVSAAQAIMP